MSISVLELNDSEIRVCQDGEIVLRSPGYAVVKDDKLELGEDALKQAHLNPRATHNQFWSNLNQDSLQYPTPLARHNADLAYTHLLAIHEKIGRPGEIVFAVPGNYTNDQLSLLLGLVQASPFTAIGLVDTAVATAAAVADRGTYIHADIHLHRTILTQLDITDHVNRTSVQVIDGTGLADIYEACAGFISDLFIQQSRFDPMHHAETEQALYNQLPQCLQSLKNNMEVLLEVEYRDARHQANLPRNQLLEKLQKIYQKITSNIPATVTCMVSDRLSVLPGFNETLNEIEILDPEFVFNGCQENILNIRTPGPALNFVTRLPTSARPSITAGTLIPQENISVDARDGQAVTHVLLDNHAYPLANGSLYLSANSSVSKDKQHNTHCLVSINNNRAHVEANGDLAVFLNGHQISKPEALQAGDIISFTGSKTEYTLINVLN